MLLEVVEVEEDRAQRRGGAAGLRGHPLERVVDGALVGQPGQRVGRGAQLGQRQVAEVREHRRGLGDRLVDAPAVGVGRRSADADEHRADHLAADQQRLAHRGVRELAADLALHDLLGRFAALVGAVEADGEAAARLGLRERRLQRAVGSSGTVGSSRSALLLRLSATAWPSGIVASRWRVISGGPRTGSRSPAGPRRSAPATCGTCLRRRAPRCAPRGRAARDGGCAAPAARRPRRTGR